MATEFSYQWARIGLERIGHDPMGGQHVAVPLRFCQRSQVDQQRLGPGELAVDHALNHRLHLGLDRVALVDHELDLVGRCACLAQFHEDVEQLERVV